MSNQEFFTGLKDKFPIIKDLLFFKSDNDEPETLPSLIALMAAMTDPTLPGDVCVVLPCRDNVAAFTAVLAALSAAKDHFPELHRKYIQEGFEIGEYVRVLPTGHVFEFGGFFTEEYGQFFKLGILNDDSKGVRSFPIRDAVLLEKTNRSAPKGTGRTKLGSYLASPIDVIIDIQSGGNNALLANEIMLVSTQREFVEFIETTYVCHIDTPTKPYLLRDVIPWGIVNSEGDIEFRDSSAASGEPLIAVSSRTEYIAEACRKLGAISPRVIIDGAVRIKDLQSFDDIVDYSKLLVLADHTRLDDFTNLADRECTVWKLPDGLDEFIDSENNLLQKFNRAYKVASNHQFDIVNCESLQFDGIARKLKEAEQNLKDCDADQEDMKALSIAYSRLIDLAAFVHIPSEASIAEIRASMEAGKQILSRRSLFMDGKANELLGECFSLLGCALDQDSDLYRTDKQLKLLDLVRSLQGEGSRLLVIAPTIYSAESSRKFFDVQPDCNVKVATIHALPEGEVFDHAILTGWPKARHLKKFLDRYLVSNIHALAYQFENRWFSNSRHRRARQLNHWESNSSMAGLAGVDTKLYFNPLSVPPPPAVADDSFLDTERLLDGIKKGLPSGVISEHDLREGKYVSFSGSCYGYMTKTHKIPKLTGLITGALSSDQHIPLETIDNLQIGDFVLFRANDGVQKDLIRQIAEQALGEVNYSRLREKSEKWKIPLILLGATQQEVINKLHAAGMTRGDQTIRSWMNDPARIGPQDYEDLSIIATCATGNLLAGEIEDIWGAVKQVRAAHMSAGMKLSKLLVEHLPGQLPDIEEEETKIELVLGDLQLGKVLIVQIDDIGERFEKRAHWEVNQVLEDL